MRAPVALFCFNRPQHLKETIQALRNNVGAFETECLVFSDAPKKESDVDRVEEVRKFLKTIDGFKTVQIIERKENLGLSKSIITGVSDLLNRFGRVIVLEDDLVTSPYFLTYMDEALTHYEDEKRVCSVNGYCYPIKTKLPETYFRRGADCWGWGTWKRAWEQFEPDGKTLLQRLRTQKLEHEFDEGGSYPYVQLLELQVKGQVDSWAIRWQASMFLKDYLTLYPGRSLVQNIGMDGSGTHCGTNEALKTSVSTSPIQVRGIPVREEPEVIAKTRHYLMHLNDPPSLFQRVISKGRRALKGIR